MNQIVIRAKNFAFKAHEGQKYGALDYSYHLEQVVEQLKKAEITDDYILAAGFLHDTIEDTNTTFNEILKEFGSSIARLVFAITNESGKNRTERNARTYPKILAAGRDATAVKLADRIANVSHSLKHNHGMFQMYKREYDGFRAYLKIQGELKSMWATLDNLMETVIEE